MKTLVLDYREALAPVLGERSEDVVRGWYHEERQRFEFPDGIEAGRAKILDFVPILTRRAVEERIRKLLDRSEPAFEGAA
ncbi:MAG: hypothetical protein V2A77_04075 [Pseudomonadota bacterium]